MWFLSVFLDVSRDSEDSGIGHAILESPCIPLFSSPSLFSSSSLPAHLARLQAFPVSPNSPHKLLDISRPVVEEFVYSYIYTYLFRDLLSPMSEDRLLTHLQEDCRTFDSVLALKLPCEFSTSCKESEKLGSSIMCVLSVCRYWYE